MPKPHGGTLINNFIDASKIGDDLFVLDTDLGLKKEAVTDIFMSNKGKLSFIK